MSEQSGNKGPPIGTGVFVILTILVLLIAAVVIHDASGIISSFSKHLMHLFENAGLNPNNQHKFGNFVELILIAAFFGWVWSRFKRK